MTARKKNEDKRKTGRKSSYQDAFANQALKLALLGAKDEELADFFGVDVSTINRWKKKYPEFCESLKKGKDIADSNVASKLYNRAIGYDFEETAYCPQEWSGCRREAYQEASASRYNSGDILVEETGSRRKWRRPERVADR